MNTEKCEICERTDVGLCNDHSHRTGKLRGKLCNQCNLILGILEKNIHKIERMNFYIKNKENKNDPTLTKEMILLAKTFLEQDLGKKIDSKGRRYHQGTSQGVGSKQLADYFGTSKNIIKEKLKET